MIDQATAIAFDAALKKAQRNGTSVQEALDAAGLLVTSKRKAGLEYQAMLALQTTLDEIGAGDLMRMRHNRVSGSPAEMFEAMMHFVAQYVGSRRIM